MTPDWFPDWTGTVVAVVASGPSAKKTNLDLLRGRATRVVAINDSLDLCPWADMVYGCDPRWWKLRRGLPGFSGLKVCWEGDRDHRPADFSDLRRISIDVDQRFMRRPDRPLFEVSGTVGSGGNSGFQAVNLVGQFGSRKIILVGFDMHDRQGTHWFGRNNGYGLSNPDETNFSRWRRAFDDSAEDFIAHGFDIVNTSRTSDLKCFRTSSIETALAEWRVP